MKLQSNRKKELSCASIIKFFIFNLMDYSNINSDKFIKNITKFDIRETVETIMTIQQNQAKETNIKFTAEFENIKNQECN